MINKSSKTLSVVAGFISRFAGPKNIVGFVERIEPTVVAGWAIERAKKPLQISLCVNGRNYPLDAGWIERGDVAQQYGEHYLYAGFRCAISPEIAEVLRLAIDASQKIEVLANGKSLAIANGAFLATSLRRELLALKMRTEQVSVEIESWGHFTLYGSMIMESGAEPAIGLRCNGEALECTVFHTGRTEIDETGGDNPLRVGIEIELPGYLWECVTIDGEAKLELLLNGQPVEHEPIVLKRTKAARWITEISQAEEGARTLVRSLLALEHLRYGALFQALEEKEARYFRDFAERMQLGAFILPNPNDATGNGVRETADVPTESVSTLLLWRALRELNRRIQDRDQPVFDLVKTVIQELKLKDEARERFLLSVVPLLCHSGEFLRLREFIQFGSLERLGSANKLCEMTLSVPAMIADGHVVRATDVLYRTAKSLSAQAIEDNSWLNTECLRYSVQLLQRMEADGEAEIAVAEKFRYAVIAVLDAFKGEWFSRLHDRNLIDCMILLLGDIDRYTDYHRRDVVAAAQRIYGLTPTFWQRAADRELPGLDRELARSHAHFMKLHRAFEAGCKDPVEWLEEIAEPLAYYRVKNNPEAVIYLREVCVNLLPAFNEALPVRAKALLSRLLASDPAEALRIAAFPLREENHLLEAFPETEPVALRETLRSLSDPDKSVAWHLQESASAALRALLETEPGDKRKMAQALEVLERHAITLANWQGGFLAFDLLASGYAFALVHDIESMPLISRMLAILKKAVEETKADLFLPASVLAGLSRLTAITSGNAGLRGFLTESRNLIRAKFGERMDDLFILPERLALRTGTGGWPQDTLVVIYSCRKYLDTRVKAIRETWVQDLKARGIPYLVLVGDGDDTITDDVLALDVSDKYEDLPKKSLKLFDWVYRNSDVQYVLKIDDDCYLDVARFFDTLSYRKSFYYGRVIRRGIGSMDRAWHQPKSHTLHSRKTLDKSPEPSVYADGGGGYTLSRLAMQQLLKAEKTPQGERLKACSFMEDKLVGDLLALSHIEPSNEDYDSYQRRRTFGEAMPVGMWENSFFPCQATPTKMVHLDSAIDLYPTHDNAGSKELWPKKLWPTSWAPTLKLKYPITAQCGNNQLELLSDSLAAAILLEQMLLVVCVVRNEITMLPHFLAHYRALGVKCFVFVDNCSDDGTREYLVTQPDVILYSADTEYKYSHYGVAWQQAVLGNLCLGKWVLLADADEFLVFEGAESGSLGKFVADIEAEGKDAVCTVMVDMYPEGDLIEADFSKHNPFDVACWFDVPVVTPWRLGSGWFSNSVSHISHLRHRVVPNAVPHDFVSQKYALFRYNPWVRLSQGVHYASSLNVSDRQSWFAHFKYHAGFKEKIETEIRRGQHFNNAAEYRRYAAMLAEGQGGFGKDGVSLKYEGSQSFSRLVNAR